MNWEDQLILSIRRKTIFFFFAKMLGITHCVPLEVSFQSYHGYLKAQGSRERKTNLNSLNDRHI